MITPGRLEEAAFPRIHLPYVGVRGRNRGEALMRAVVFKAARDVAVEDVDDARIERDDDAVVRITSSALCGTDRHRYEGRTGAAPGMVLGHEGMGVVEAVGPAVTRVKPGDRVVLPAHLYCGVCYNCARGYSAACLRVHPGHVGGAYAMPGMG